VIWLPGAANVVPISPILVTLLMEAIRSSETSVLTRATRRNIPEDGILYSRRRENLKSYMALTGWTLYWRRNVSPAKQELGFYIPEYDILHSHRHENFKSDKKRGDKQALNMEVISSAETSVRFP
jgi:hypothetical protein